MRDIVEGGRFADIDGLSYRENGQVRHTSPRAVNMDLDRYPFPAYHMVDFRNYFPAVASYRNLPAINMLMTRGCPGKCTFCNSALTTLRMRDPAKVVEQIRHLRDVYGIRQIQFYDDTFTILKKNVLEFCRLLAAADLGVTWTAYIRGDCFSDDMAAAMKNAGCHQVLMGIETGNLEIAKTIGKPIKHEFFYEAVRIAHRHRLEVRGSFIIGHMGETWQTMEDTLRFAIDLDVDLFQLSINTPYPGTALYNDATSRGWVRHKNWYRYGQGEVIIDQPQLPAEDIYRFERFAFRKFYLRPKVVMRMIRRIAHPRHVRDYALAALILLLRKHKKKGGYDWTCWQNLREADFFDTEIEGPHETLRLSHQLRQDAGFV